MYVRVNRGHFDPASQPQVADLLQRSQAELGPAIKRLPGLRSYVTGLDRAAGLMIAISTYDTAGQAQAMGSLPEMAVARGAFEAAGIQFETPITYEILWAV